MLYIPWMVPLGDPNVKKKNSKTLIFEVPGLKSCISRLCTNPLEDTPQPPPPLTPPPHLPQKLQKVNFKWGGGADQKLIVGYAYWTK